MPNRSDLPPQGGWIKLLMAAVASLVITLMMASVGMHAITTLIAAEQACDDTRQLPIPSKQLAINVYMHNHLADLC